MGSKYNLNNQDTDNTVFLHFAYTKSFVFATTFDFLVNTFIELVLHECACKAKLKMKCR